MRGKSLAIEMAGFEQQVAQKLFTSRLSKFSASDRASAISNINERFNGGFDRFVGSSVRKEKRGHPEFIDKSFIKIPLKY